MKKLYYIANIRMPTEKAHGIQIMKMAEAFADLGVEVELVVPLRKNEIKADPFDYYGVRRNFRIRKLWCLDLVRFGKIGFWIQSLTFAERAAWYSLRKQGIFYTRDELLAAYLKGMGKTVVWEAHMGQENFFTKMLINARIPLVVISSGLKDLYQGLGMPTEKIRVAPDGVDIEQFSIQVTKAEAREQLKLPMDKKLVLYTGHLYSWKGADTLAQAAGLIDGNIRVAFVGGTEKDIQRFKEKYGHIKNVDILGKKLHHEMPLYMRSADLLVLPNSAMEDISRLYTSPMKLFEYMASGTPIAASDLPSIREVLDESSACFFRPDDSRDLARAIDETFERYAQAQERAKVALEEVREYSWQKRAEKILNFLNA